MKKLTIRQGSKEKIEIRVRKAKYNESVRKGGKNRTGKTRDRERGEV